MAAKTRLRSAAAATAMTLALAMLSSRGAAAGEAPGQPTTAELLQRIEALEKALADVKRDAERCQHGQEGQDEAPVATRTIAVRKAPAQEPAVSTAEATADAEPSPPSLTAGYRDGFFLASKDQAYELKIGGLLHADSRWFVDNGPASGVDQFTIRRARLDVRGTIASRFGFQLTPDFAGSKLVLLDAFVDAEVTPWLSIRAGKFKTPVGIERLQNAPGLLFIERSLVDNLMPNRDVGVQLAGEFGGGTLAYELAVLNGVPDGSSGDEDVNDAVDIAARVFARPYVTSMYSPLRGAGFGVAGTWGREQGTPASSELPSLETSGRSTFFRYASDSPATAVGTSIADGDRWRVSPQASWYEGRFGMLSEYVVSSQQVALGAARGWVTNDAWQMRASWVLTGEKASPHGLVPDAPFDFGGGRWGAWETALRWASLDVDGGAFAHGFADPSVSARHADAIATAINWYLNRHVALYFNYEHTMFGGGAAGGDRANEDVFLMRMQLVF